MKLNLPLLSDPLKEEAETDLFQKLKPSRSPVRAAPMLSPKSF